jgi:hypothetical protein
MTNVRFFFLLVFLLLVAVESGCTKSSVAPAQIGGTVKYKDQPLKGGKLTFHSMDAGTYTTVIREDGSFTLSDLPADELRVSVETESINPTTKLPEYGQGGHKMPGYNPPGEQHTIGKGPEPGAYVKIPSKYSKPGTSGLTVSLKAGKNWKDIELTD